MDTDQGAFLLQARQGEAGTSLLSEMGRAVELGIRESTNIKLPPKQRE